jgi:hypothetical protein
VTQQCKRLPSGEEIHVRRDEFTPGHCEFLRGIDESTHPNEAQHWWGGNKIWMGIEIADVSLEFGRLSSGPCNPPP